MSRAGFIIIILFGLCRCLRNSGSAFEIEAHMMVMHFGPAPLKHTCTHSHTCVYGCNLNSTAYLRCPHHFLICLPLSSTKHLFLNSGGGVRNSCCDIADVVFPSVAAETFSAHTCCRPFRRLPLPSFATRLFLLPLFALVPGNVTAWPCSAGLRWYWSAEWAAIIIFE